MEELKNYLKPLAYLDQNILDYLSKETEVDDEAIQFLKENFQIVYSSITLQEIYKAGLNGGEHYSNNFLRLLTYLDAQFIFLQIIDNQVTNTLMRSLLSPQFHYQEFLSNLNFDDFTYPVLKTNLAVWGGIDNLDQLRQEQKNSLVKLIVFMQEQLNYLKSLESSDPVIIEFIYDFSKKLKVIEAQKNQFNINVDFSIDNLKKIRDEDKSGSMLFRKAIKVDINQLRSFEKPNILEKIYKSLKDNNPDLHMDIEEFFQLKNNYIQPDRDLFVFEKVNIIFTMLNFIGYFSDKKLNRENEFFASFRDMNHASYACFCEYFFSKDMRLKKKITAIYEYLNISTQICDIQISSK